MKSSTLITIVDRGKSARLMVRARDKGAPGGTILYGRGTASSSIISLLGLGDRRKELLINVVESEKSSAILDEMMKAGVYGVAILIDNQAGEEDSMECGFELIEVICADGLSDDIMAAARKAGATGGTVLSGRGTCTEDDQKFFGAPLVPEKEILMIVADRSKAQAIKDAINSLDILKQKGMGIVFSMPVKEFRSLS